MTKIQMNLLMAVYMFMFIRSKTEQIAPSTFAIGALEPMQNASAVFTKAELAALKQAAGSFGNMWSFKRCEMRGTTYQSQSYKRVPARNNYTVAYSTSDGQAGYG